MNFNINDKHIKKFLDKLDVVLNSNTFLFHTQLNFLNLEKTKEDFSEYIRSLKFLEEILLQDEIRKWNNFRKYRQVDKKLIPFIKEKFELKAEEIPDENKVMYLQNMLSIEQENPTFRSPYNKQISSIEAEKVVLNFLNVVVKGQKWKLIKFNTDFGYPGTFGNVDPSKMSYFEGGACDTVTVVITEKNDGFIILTNGLA